MRSVSNSSKWNVAAAKSISLKAVALLAACAVCAAPAFAKSDEVTRAPSGVTYVTGGTGSEAVDALNSMQKDFNLKLVFANKAGAYLSDVKVTIVDASGKVALDVTTEGPMLLAKLPAGAYKIDATFGGKTQTRNITLAAARLESVSLEWAAS